MITKKYSLKNSQREKIVNRFSSYLIERYKEIIAVYLYGSFNTAGQFSDIDLAYVFRGCVSSCNDIGEVALSFH